MPSAHACRRKNRACQISRHRPRLTPAAEGAYTGGRCGAAPGVQRLNHPERPQQRPRKSRQKPHPIQGPQGIAAHVRGPLADVGHEAALESAHAALPYSQRIERPQRHKVDSRRAAWQPPPSFCTRSVSVALGMLSGILSQSRCIRR